MRGSRPEHGAEHFASPRGARTLETDDLRLARLTVVELIETSTMGALYGQAGTGKTFTINKIAAELAATEVIVVEFESRPTMLHVATTLYGGLFGDEPAVARRSRISPLLIDALSRRGRDGSLLVIVDEAQPQSRML